MNAAPSATAAADLTQTAQDAARRVAAATSAQKKSALLSFAALLRDNAAAIRAANGLDLQAAANLPAALKERLELDDKRINTMAAGVAQVAEQPDPVGRVSDIAPMPSGISVGKMRVPLGVVLFIYESRPNVTADAAALAVQSGNAIILRGGKEAQHSNRAIGDCLQTALAKNNLQNAAQVVGDSSRDIVGELLRNEKIDLVIPRGGRELITRVAAEATMPVLKHLDGNCHIYIDAAADLQMAERVVVNAKTRRYGVCNAAESLLIHAAAAKQFAPQIAAALQKKGVEIRACEKARELISDAADIKTATEEDWRAEYLAPIISVKIVNSAAEAIAHIDRYGSAHSDAIVTDSQKEARRFLREVDSSSVLVNASTAFADGGEYGLGAEVGISTGKLHARGPVGAEGLTTQKYIVWGDGNCRGA